MILCIGLLALAGLITLRQHHGAGNELPINSAPSVESSAAVSPQSEAAKLNVTKTNVVEVNESRPSVTAAVATGATNSAGSSPSGSDSGLTHEEYVEKRVGELMDLGMTDDPGALKTILSEVGNADGEIRKAAIEAVKQFGSTNAIPSLEEAISKTDSAEDKQDLKEAIEFLKLPSFVAKRN